MNALLFDRMRIISNDIKVLQRHARDYELHFDARNAFQGVSYRGVDDSFRDADDPFCIELRGTCQFLPQYLDDLWKSREEADLAISRLPRRLTEALDALAGKPWVASVRRNCLDKILAWPGETAHQTSYAARKVYGSVKELLKNADRYPPFETWEGYYSLMNEYGHDLYSIRHLVQTVIHETDRNEQPILPIVLSGQGKPVKVKGKEKAALTDPQYNVLAALLAAGARGLNKDELVNESGHGDAVRILKRITEIDADWKAAIAIAGKTGGGYRILDLDQPTP
jgi:hypothetical protein